MINYKEESFKTYGCRYEYRDSYERHSYGNTYFDEPTKVKYVLDEEEITGKSTNGYINIRKVLVKRVSGNEIYRDLIYGERKSSTKCRKLIKVIENQIADLNSQIKSIMQDRRYNEDYKAELTVHLKNNVLIAEEYISNLNGLLNQYEEEKIARNKKKEEKLFVRQYTEFKAIMNKGLKYPESAIKRWQDKNDISNDKIEKLKSSYKEEISQALKLLNSI